MPEGTPIRQTTQSGRGCPPQPGQNTEMEQCRTRGVYLYKYGMAAEPQIQNPCVFNGLRVRQKSLEKLKKSVDMWGHMVYICFRWMWGHTPRSRAAEAAWKPQRGQKGKDTMNTNTTNKKSISVSNLTLDLYLKYVRPAAIKAGILEDAVTEEGRPYHITDEATAKEIEDAMRCACFNAGYDGIERTHEEYIAHEADGMLYQLDVSMKYCKDSKTVKALQALRDAIAEGIDRAKVEKMVEAVAQKVEQTKTRSAWDRGVKAYAEELVEELREFVEGGYVDESDLSNRRLFERAMLNGAADWRQYSEGGCSLCYDGQIAERLCAPWELRKTDNGRRDPNPRESWIDVQSRALYQAAQLVLRVAF